jgi:hypothetical protein
MYTHNTIYNNELAEYNKLLMSLDPESNDIPLAPIIKIFQPLKHCTATLEGCLTNVDLHEEAFLYMIRPSIESGIYKIECNFGTRMAENYTEPEKKKISNRGRKPDVKPVSYRVKQGNGECMSSQTTLTMKDVLDPISKLYKIRMFRTGHIECLGVQDAKNYTDILPIVYNLCRILSEQLCEDVTLEYIKPIMINYTFMAVDQRIFLHNQDLFKLLLQEQKQPHSSDVRDHITFMKYNQEKDKFITFKFATPVPSNPDKKITLIIRNKSKVNIYGAHSYEIAQYYHNWFNEFCLRHPEILFIPPINSDSE